MEKKWIVLAGSFLIMTIIPGFIRSMNVMYVDLIETFSVTHAEAAMVQSSVAGMYGLSGFFTGPFINCLGTRRSGFIGTLMTSLALVLAYFVNHILLLTVILALGTGIGSSAMFIAAQTLVEACFDKKSKTMAISFVMFGAGAGGLWLPYLMAYLVDEYGVRGALLICGGIQSNCLVIFTAIGLPDKLVKPSKQLSVDNGKIMLPDQIVQSENEDGCHLFTVNGSKKDCRTNLDRKKNKIKSDHIICSLLKNLPFVMLIFGFGFALTVVFTIAIVMMDYVEILGYQRSAGVTLITVINAIDTLSRLLPGLLKPIPKISVLLSSAVLVFVSGVSVICLPFTANFLIAAFLFSVVVGICQGYILSTRSLCIIKVIGDNQFSSAMGIVLTVQGTGMIIAGPITGLIKDIWGSYDIAFFLCGGTMLTCGVILTIAFVYTNR